MNNKLLVGIVSLLPLLLFFSALALASYLILLAVVYLFPLLRPSLPTLMVIMLALPWVTWFLWQRVPQGEMARPLFAGLKQFLVIFVPFIGLLGLLPHGLFSADLGAWHYIATAWDEDSYVLLTLDNAVPVYRWLSGAVVNLLRHAWDLDTALILMDVIPPMLAAGLTALIAYYAGFRSFSGLFLASCLLLFALALMAFCSAALVGVHVTQLLPFSSLLYPEWLRMFVPNLFENFLSLYKSPEPQICLVIQFATLLALLRHAQTQQPRYVMALALLSLTFPFIYITSGIALIIVVACYGALNWWTSRNRCYLWIVSIAIGATAFGVFWYMRQPPALSASIFIYHSRLPIFSASLMWAAILACILLRNWGHRFVDTSLRSTVPSQALLAFACCLVPLITLNQQIITDTMVQSRTWDYYTNMPFVAFALLLVWPHVQQRVKGFIPSRITSYLPGSGLVAFGLAAWLCWAQIYVYQYYSPSNLDNLAAARTLNILYAQYPQSKLMLEVMGDDSQVALRMGESPKESIAGYRQIMKNFAAPLSAGSQAHGDSIAKIKEQAFTYFDRKGLSPETLETLMVDEAKAANAGPHILYFFSVLDCWRAASDHRQYKVEAMLDKIPSLVADYKEFLGDRERRMQFGNIFYVTRTKRPERNDLAWNESLAGIMTIGSHKPVTVYVYHQLSN